jgi:SOS-response transcriptional repressor LexA
MSDDSLVDIGIPAHSRLMFRRSKRYQDGDLVFVMTPDGGFVVAAFREVVLRGAHPECPVRRYLAAEVEVLGVYHSTLREGGAW